MDYRIVDLRDVPHVLPTLCRWHFEMWTHLYPEETLAMREERMQSYLGTEFLPSTFVALSGDRPLGSGAIIPCDMETHDLLSPWLASLFVAPMFRRMGIGQALVTYILEMCRAHQVGTLYLFTPDRRPFYERLGWTTIASPEYHGETVTVMRYELRGETQR